MLGFSGNMYDLLQNVVRIVGISGKCSDKYICAILSNRLYWDIDGLWEIVGNSQNYSYYIDLLVKQFDCYK